MAPIIGVIIFTPATAVDVTSNCLCARKLHAICTLLYMYEYAFPHTPIKISLLFTIPTFENHKCGKMIIIALINL